VKKGFPSVIVAVFIVLFAPIPAYAQVSQAVSDGLGEAVTKAETAREKAVDFEGPSYFPGEWENAETLYNRAGQMPRDNDDDAEKAAETYAAAADLYESVFTLTIPLYAQAREDEIMAVRAELIGAGAKDSFPEFFTPADKEAVLALDQYEAADYYPARETARSALSMYNILKTAFNVRLIRQDIIASGLENYDSENFDSGDTALSDAMDAYTAKDLAGTQAKVDEALQKYNLVLRAGRTAYAEFHSSLAESERQAALEAKADIAVKNMFEEADSVHKNSNDLLQAKNYEEAARGFIRAESLYIAASTATSEKRRTADAAIKNARAKIEETIKTARQAGNQ
jgi:hypothetical protein